MRGIVLFAHHTREASSSLSHPIWCSCPLHQHCGETAILQAGSCSLWTSSEVQKVFVQKCSLGQGWGGSVLFFSSWSNNANRESGLEGKIGGQSNWQERKKRYHFPLKEEKKTVLTKKDRGKEASTYLLIPSHPFSSYKAAHIT